MVFSGVCENRAPLSGAPSTCLLDTLIVPLPSFLLLIVFAGLTILARLRSPLPSITSRRNAATLSFPRWLHILYTVLICAEAIMTILEFVRLILVQEGVGLLPVNTVALACIAALMCWRGRQRNLLLACLLCVYWMLALSLEALKVARLSLLNMDHPSTDKRYPTSDWLLDNEVILALYAAFFLLESAYILLTLKQRGSYAIDDDEPWNRMRSRKIRGDKSNLETIEDLGVYPEETQTPLMNSGLR